MKKLLIATIAFAALAACSPKQEKAEATVAACGGDAAPVAAQTCDIKTDATTYRVKFGPAQDAGAGTIAVDVLVGHDAVGQTLSESGVSGYSYPKLEDVDGDGKADILIARDAGAVNRTIAFWRQKEDGGFARVGEVNGTQLIKTPDGFISVPARSSAAEWVITFYRVDETALTKLAAVTTKVEKTNAEGVPTDTSCTLTDESGIGVLDMTDKAAELKFCSDPTVTILFAE